MMKARKGDWVQVEFTVLSPEGRAPQVPEDTKRVPLMARVKGFLLSGEATVGDTVTIRTLSGRTVVGRLVSVNPRYEHDFGDPVPELVTVGPELRELLEGSSGGEHE